MGDEIDPEQPAVAALGIEIGSRGLRAVVATRGAQILESVRAIGPPANAQSAVEQTFRLVEQLLDHPRVRRLEIGAAGIAFGGPVDPQRGTTIDAPRTAGFESFPLAGLLEERIGIPVYLENDSRAAAYGEYRFGAGRGAHGLLYMQFGVGVGGGLVLRGRLEHGAGMTAGEFGHMPVSASGPRCSCGKPGHLEAYVSEPAILRRLQQESANADQGELLFPENRVEQVFANRDDPVAEAIASEAIQMIGIAIASLVTALSCDMVVLGGYASRIGTPFVAGVRARVRQHALESALRRLTISTAQLGADASLIGVTSLALNLHEQQGPKGGLVV
jgi:glucokinase